ncbi:DinB family protein [Mucilaginibacter ginsenosidivorax]|uniref:DinB family protein n=1 Tax=Mucilaginibacter ginsenosidivorax TaxID=862126 RepID=A0A5B8VYL0_9SPHI|nr:DinB family protein [Mucilaginibacter ginsenosidivorax]QEC76529.1 DinB family protein [Mucilaginibacter ginsenosidivorax]
MDKQTIKAPGNLPEPLTISLESTMNELMQVIASIKPTDFNRVPQPGSWTPAQHLEHLRLSLQGAVSTLNGPAKVTLRSPDQYVDIIKGIFLDFDAQYPAAPTLIPDNKDYDKAPLADDLSAVSEQLKEIVQNQDLTGTCLIPEFTGIGLLTRLEWAAVAVYHAYRHVHKLNAIVRDFASSAGS